MAVDSADSPDESPLPLLWRDKLNWRQRLAWAVLVPPACVYAGAMRARALLYRARPLRKRIDGLRVISVGNLTVGGNGKTPLAIYLANLLVKHGLRTAIVSRGYRGSYRGRAALVAEGGRLKMKPEEAGDEAVMMARCFPGTVAVGRRRIDAIRLLTQSRSLDAVVLDDAFQHLALERDVDIVTVRTDRGFGNRWVLPAGPLREPLGALKRAAAVVVLSTPSAPQLAPEMSRQLDGLPVIHGRLVMRSLVSSFAGLWREHHVELLAGRRVVAVSGIASARSFHAMLHSLDVDLVAVFEYPDHHSYSWRDWQEVARAAGTEGVIVTTEKDLVKLEQFPFARDTLFALRIAVNLDADEEKLLAMLTGGDKPRQQQLDASG